VNDEILGVRELHLLPLDHLTAENYTAVLTNDTFQLYFINSTIIVVAVTLLTLGVGIPATCSVNRFKYPGHKYTVLGLISSQTLPLVLVFITFVRVYPASISPVSRRCSSTGIVYRCIRRVNALLRDGLRTGDHPVSPVDDLFGSDQGRDP